MGAIHFYRDFEFQYGVLETVSPLIRRIVAPNPGPFTGAGTGTYVVGRGRVAVIDPGPEIASHVRALLSALRGETVESILITHSHMDHWPATAAIQQATGARVYGFGSKAGQTGGDGTERAYYGFVPQRTIGEGDTLDGPGWHLTVLHTPGHASDHLCFALAEEKVLFSGDHVMGWSTSVIMPPDGDMAAYVRSLERLLARDDALYLPTHGPAIPSPQAHVRAFIEHRRERRDAILRRLAKGEAAIPQIVEAVYVGLTPGLRGAAAQSVLAHLIELAAAGKVESDGRRYRLAG